MSKFTRPAALAGALAVTMLLAGCAGGAGASGSPSSSTSTSADAVKQVSGTVTVYTSEPQDKLNELIADFNQVQPNVKVNAFRAGTGDLTTRIESERKSGGVKADVLWAADAATFEQYKSDDLLLKYTPTDAKQLQSGMAEGFYTGTRIIPTVIAYNTSQITSAPKSWKSLADSKYAGKITLPNPAVSGAAAYNAAAWYLTDGLGESWFQALGENKPVVADSNGPVSQSVAAGTQPVGIVVDYLVRDLKAKGSPIAVSYPSEGVPYVDEPIGIFQSSQNTPAAKAFVDYVLSARGQKLAVKQNYLPVRGDVGTPAGAPELSKIKLLTPSLDKITAIKPTALDAFTKNVG